jgi:predicted AAA+ superfamily ATPase
MKLKSFCTIKGIVAKLKKQSTEWEKIFASYPFEKELLTRMSRVLKKLNAPKINDPIGQIN